MSLDLDIQPPAAPYNFDDDLPPFQLEMFLNDTLNDCVMAARAHHTIRLSWDGVHPLMNISDSDVSVQYYAETGGPDDGLDLASSLDEWKTSGWTISPDPTQRKISGHSKPFTLQGGLYAGSDSTLLLSEQQLRAGIYTGIGAQVNLILPRGVGPSNTSSFGPGHSWQTAPDADGDLHVMLLTGYSSRGFLGITWAQRQEMSFAFLQSNCWGVFFIQK